LKDQIPVFLHQDKTYAPGINGHLILHTVTRPLKARGVITVKDKLIKALSFTIWLSDYKKIQTFVTGNISKKILVKNKYYIINRNELTA